MPELVSLSIDNAPNKTTYFVGDRFERYGMVVKAHYDDGTSNTIDFYMCSPINPLTMNDIHKTIFTDHKHKWLGLAMKVGYIFAHSPFWWIFDLIVGGWKNDWE